jgi:hypothetical protein
MGLLFVEGFDHYTSYSQKWNGYSTAGANGSATYGPSYARGGSGQGLAIQSGNSAGAVGTNLYKSIPQRTTLVLGFAWQNQGVGTSAFSRTLCTFWDGGTIQMDVRMNESFNLYVVRNNSTTIIPPSAISCPALQWRYIEVKITCGASGYAELRIDGVPQGTFTGNTSGSGSNFVTRFSLGGITMAINVFDFFDDLYLLEADSGTGLSDFLGNVRVQTLMPSAPGSNTQMSRGGAQPSNWQSVNEIPPDTASTVFSNTAGVYDTYRYPVLSALTNRVLAVAQSFEWQKDDSGSRTATARVRSGGNEADFVAPVIPLFGTYAVQQQIQEQNPITSSPWLVSEVNAFEVGPKVAS